MAIDITFAQRRTILRKVQGLVNEMVQANESAFRYAAIVQKAGVADDADAAVKVDAFLQGIGPATNATPDGTLDTVSDLICSILYGALTDGDTSTVLGWGWDGT